MANIVRKAFINKSNNQISISVPKKEIKKNNPKMNFDEDLFFEIKLLRRKRNGI